MFTIVPSPLLLDWLQRSYSFSALWVGAGSSEPEKYAKWESRQMDTDTLKYLKAGYGEGGVRLFLDKSWGWIDKYSTRNISITYKESIPQWGWPTTWTSAQRSCGLSIFGGAEDIARQGPEQNWDNSRAAPVLSRGMVYVTSRCTFRLVFFCDSKEYLIDIRWLILNFFYFYEA